MNWHQLIFTPRFNYFDVVALSLMVIFQPATPQWWWYVGILLVACFSSIQTKKAKEDGNPNGE